MPAGAEDLAARAFEQAVVGDEQQRSCASVDAGPSTRASQAIDASPSTGDDYGMSDYTYDELVRFHEQMTRRLSQLTAKGLIEFHVSRPRGVVEVLVSHPYDQRDLDALVAGIPRGAYEVLTTADAGEAAAVSPSSQGRRLHGRFDRIIRRIVRRRDS